MTHLRVITDAFPDRGVMDVAVSHSILRAVARGELSDVFRLHVPGSVLAFGRSDRSTPGYPSAVRAAKAHGFEPVERLAGGKAAVFHKHTLAFSWATADPEPMTGITERFETISSLLAEAFQSLGVDARVGAIPGEYCPGEWSISVAGRVKVMGVGQRLMKGAAHVGGVIVVDQGYRIRHVLVPVYRALGIDWDPRTAGSLADRSPGLDTGIVSAAVLQTMAERFDIEEGSLPEHIVDDALDLIPDHLPQVA